MTLGVICLTRSVKCCGVFGIGGMPLAGWIGDSYGSESS
jgi:hypothetical protein